MLTRGRGHLLTAKANIENEGGHGVLMRVQGRHNQEATIGNGDGLAATRDQIAKSETTVAERNIADITMQIEANRIRRPPQKSVPIRSPAQEIVMNCQKTRTLSIPS